MIKKVISFYFGVGGCGRTSISYSIAVELANMKYKTLFIDADPQGNATAWEGITAENIEYNLSDVLYKRCGSKKAIKQTKLDNLFILPTISKGELPEEQYHKALLGDYMDTKAYSNPYAVKQMIRENNNDFDYIIIDCCRGWSGFLKSIFLASTDVIPIINLSEFSKVELQFFCENLRNFKEDYDVSFPNLTEIIVNQYNKSLDVHNQYFYEFKKMVKKEIFIVPTDQSFPKAQKMHYPVQYITGTKEETLNVLHDIAVSVC